MHATAEKQRGHSLVSLIGANLIAIVLALIEGWNLAELMIVYWFQSVVIGVFSARRILDLKSFSTEGLTMNGSPVRESAEAKKKIAAFFVLHYGAFHIAYLFFIATKNSAVSVNLFFLLICIAVFVLNHWYSYVENRASDASRKPNIGTIMFFPYLRVIPMHLTIVAGGAVGGDTSGLLLVFLALKMIADALMHHVEHHYLGR